MDIFDEIKRDAAAGELPNNKELGEIKALVDSMLALEERIKKGDALLTTLREQHQRLSEITIPTAMTAVGLAKLTLDTGHTLEIKPELYAAIRADFKDQAFDWLTEHELGDVIKEELTLMFGRGEEERVKFLIDILRDNQYGNYVEKRSVHASTLKALIKEQRALGKEFPEEFFSIADISKSVVKAPKK